MILFLLPFLLFASLAYGQGRDGFGNRISSHDGAIDTYCTNCGGGGGPASAVSITGGTLTGITNPIVVTGTFYQATQPVSGTFWQNTQPVSGAFYQATQPVSGTFWQTTQPVSGPLTDTQLRLTPVPVSGSFFQATQPVSLASMPTTPVTGTFWPGTQPVSGTFWQTTQPVSLASMPSTPVTGTFWQATQPVSGSFFQATQPVSIASMPSTPVTGTFWPVTQPVSGTFWQATQPVSGTFFQATQPVSLASMPTTPVTGTFWQNTQPVSGAFFQATQPVSGTFWQATQPVSGPVTDAQLRATPVPTVQGGSTTFWSCNLTNIAATLTQCQAAPGAGLSLYLTDLIAVSNTATAGLHTVRFGTGTNCGTGTGNLFFTSATALLPSPANTSIYGPSRITYQTPIKVTANNAVCVLGVATNTTNIQINGYTTP